MSYVCVIFFFPAQLFLTEVLPASDDVDLAVGELTWSYRLLSDSASILNPQDLSVLLRSA